jgi:polyhydroxyalkanoate synthesis regulator phasin
LALSAEIAATNGDVTSIEGKFSTEKSRVESVEALLSAEIIAEHNEHVSTELVLDGKISTEKGRIDAILLASDADKDTFAEIVSLINQVDTTNDNAFASYALATDASIDSLEVALTAEISATNADVTSIDTRLGAVGASLVDSVDSLELALSAEISATNADFTSLEAVVSAADSVEKARAIAAEGSLETFFNGEVATLSDNIDALEVAHDARLDALEGYIMEDVQMVEEFKTGNGLSYTLDFNVQDDNKSLVNAFVNGHRVKVSSVEGTAIALVTPGYVIDEDDTVVFVYQK